MAAHEQTRPTMNPPAGGTENEDTTVPGQPTIPFNDNARIVTFLTTDLSTERLNSLYSLLFLTGKPENISPLHHQPIKGRTILITERPDLHLIWNIDRIFIKPLPKYLLSHSFWKAHLHHRPGRLDITTPTLCNPKDTLRLEAQGFLRTYSRLIRHESDFDMAQSLGLLPKSLDWAGWSHYIQAYAYLRDTQVARRYHYGELRLPRLNAWTMVCRGEHYFQIHYDQLSFFSCFGGPYLLLFGAVTVMLAALQTAVQMVPEGGPYREFANSFVPMSIALTAAGLLSFPVLWFLFTMRELWLFIFRYRSLAL
ncbi:uncharacterized protein PODANS_2_4510 [Podospora anserina S mat+]|uniref:Podospora anserina S mat+ genomic DNA chromosome 2, supercontig 2 n=1 Tax=Podospora anserina (strain S / ATCC MYA-4624 / DSM 980 / FGSC 10383) TaxID=515849 RepID=B2B5F6_PODAN|nr:uncharacterized protein PODANS_2_4510 [Podospora anserina S mat+]CAP73031.1 unnamed protein product [Podospora anserina S mat+]CDP25431.1 Putative protein of unknown function [Podospora anserina S mat+]